MNGLESGLVEVVDLLEELRIPYMLIGGMAMAQWAVPRSTLDIDITCWVEPERLEDMAGVLSSRLKARVLRPLEFIRDRHVFPASTSRGVPVDLIFANWPVERDAIQRAPEREVLGRRFRVAPVDYLLFLKLMSSREKDFLDARNLLQHHRQQVNIAELRTRLQEIAEGLAQPDILARLDRVLRETRS